MKIYCTVCRQTPWRTEAARQRFAASGLSVEFVEGIHGATLGLGPALRHFDNNDAYRMSAGKVGIALSKLLLWTMVAERLADYREPVLLLEDDAVLVPNFQAELEASMRALPEDWQVAHVGHCCTDGLPVARINDRVSIIKYPWCCHAVLWRLSALRVALSAFRSVRLSTHSDIILARQVYPRLRHYTLTPPLAFQEQVPSEATAFAWKDIPGWFDYARIYDENLERFAAGKRPGVFVEVGCFLGRSAAYLAGEIGRRQAPVTFYAVDTWKGTPGVPSTLVEVEKAGGDLLPVFVRNLARAGASDWVIPLQMESVRAAASFPDGWVDFCWIDADHSFEAVVADIRAWKPKIKPGGVLAGHDMDRDSVRRAVEQELRGKYRTWERCWIHDVPAVRAV